MKPACPICGADLTATRTLTLAKPCPLPAPGEYVTTPIRIVCARHFPPLLVLTQLPRPIVVHAAMALWARIGEADARPQPLERLPVIRRPLVRQNPPVRGALLARRWVRRAVRRGLRRIGRAWLGAARNV